MLCAICIWLGQILNEPDVRLIVSIHRELDIFRIIELGSKYEAITTFNSDMANLFYASWVFIIINKALEIVYIARNMYFIHYIYNFVILR